MFGLVPAQRTDPDEPLAAGVGGAQAARRAVHRAGAPIPGRRRTSIEHLCTPSVGQSRGRWARPGRRRSARRRRGGSVPRGPAGGGRNRLSGRRRTTSTLRCRRRRLGECVHQRACSPRGRRRAGSRYSAGRSRARPRVRVVEAARRTIVAQNVCTSPRCQSRSAAVQSGQDGTRVAGSRPVQDLREARRLGTEVLRKSIVMSPTVSPRSDEVAPVGVLPGSARDHDRAPAAARRGPQSRTACCTGGCPVTGCPISVSRQAQARGRVSRRSARSGTLSRPRSNGPGRRRLRSPNCTGRDVVVDERLIEAGEPSRGAARRRRQGPVLGSVTTGATSATRSARGGASRTRRSRRGCSRRCARPGAPRRRARAEAVCVTHQLPIVAARRRAEGLHLFHDPRRRNCAWRRSPRSRSTTTSWCASTTPNPPPASSRRAEEQGPERRSHPALGPVSACHSPVTHTGRAMKSLRGRRAAVAIVAAAVLGAVPHARAAERAIRPTSFARCAGSRHALSRRAIANRRSDFGGSLLSGRQLRPRTATTGKVVVSTSGASGARRAASRHRSSASVYDAVQRQGRDVRRHRHQGRLARRVRRVVRQATTTSSTR